jgi:phosphatidylethanolamine-binding protein (PEBP) family uncharacterized protein
MSCNHPFGLLQIPGVQDQGCGGSLEDVKHGLENKMCTLAEPRTPHGTRRFALTLFDPDASVPGLRGVQC